MGKLQQLTEALNTNPEVYMGCVTAQRVRGDEVDFVAYVWVAPQQEVYRTSELQRFMERIVPKSLNFGKDGRHETDHNFYSSGNGEMRLGYLQAYDTVGQERIVTTTTIEDETLEALVSVHNRTGQKENSKPLRLRIEVHPFPSIAHMKKAYQYRTVSSGMPPSSIQI